MDRLTPPHEEQASLVDEKIFVLRLALHEAAEQYRKLASIINPAADKQPDPEPVPLMENPKDHPDAIVDGKEGTGMSS